MTASYTLNQLGEAVGLEYKKTTDCTSSCTWYTDTVIPSIHSQWRAQTSSFSGESYGYDGLGRLTEVQETPAGQGCTTRLYAYDEDGNRTSQTSREPASEGKCATTGGAIQTHAYDTADRLNETGVSYDPFGNTTGLPAADAGGSALTSTFYVDDALASQEQAGVKTSYNLDPAGRVLETVSGTKKTVNHYAAPGEGVAWTCEGTEPSGKCEGAEKWSRDIGGFSGLVAVQSKGEAPVLELANLHGDIIGTASISETESKLVPANETTEYGVPRTTITAKYSWLGADEVPTELATGVIDMGARTYVPQLGRFEQTDPQPGGSINPYAYTDDDPVNQADPTGENTITYNYEAAELGPAREGLPEEYAAPGAIKPPPADHQAEAEFAAHPPWDAASSFGAKEEGSYGGGDDMHFITYRGGPGATCGSNSTTHRKCHEPKPSKPGEDQEVCGAIGGTIGGGIGAAIGGWFGGTIGSVGGAKAGEKLCHE